MCDVAQLVSTVEAYAASWIEILLNLSHAATIAVEAYAASWIEIAKRAERAYRVYVEAYAASWIEIEGLHKALQKKQRRGLRSLVD